MSEEYLKEIHVGIMDNYMNFANHNSLDHLFSWTEEESPKYEHFMSFFNDDLGVAHISNQIKTFYVEFYGEKPEERDREAWADHYRAETLKRLSGKGRSWYIGYYGYTTREYDLNNQSQIDDYFLSRLPKDKLIIIPSGTSYYLGDEIHPQLFIELSNDDLDWAVDHIWLDAYCNQPIEGYNLPSGMINQIAEWSECPKDLNLFNRIIQSVDSMFYTYPSENRHFCFITDKYTQNTFLDKIRFMEFMGDYEQLVLDS